MLLYKAWLESRIRFFVGLFAVVAVCILFIRLHPILIPGWVIAMGQPKEPKPWWLSLGIREYGFYLWHFLFENKLQQILVLFAVLFGLGGLSREWATGVALYSLGLPISRRRWLFSRILVALMESGILALSAVLAIAAASVSIHQAFSLREVFLHCALMFAGAIVFTAVGILMSILFRGEQLVQLSIIALLLLPYIVLQEFNRGPHPGWQNFVNIAGVLSGPWDLTWTNIPWVGLVVTWLLAGALFWISAFQGDHVDF